MVMKKLAQVPRTPSAELLINIQEELKVVGRMARKAQVDVVSAAKVDRCVLSHTLAGYSEGFREGDAESQC